MKRVLIFFICIILFITIDVKALGMLPAIITSSDNNESQAIEFLNGEYILPEYCFTKGCTITIDSDSLKAIGRYEMDTRKEYFYISDGGGVIVYDESGDNQVDHDTYLNNFNKIIIIPDSFIENTFVILKMGSLGEERTIKLVPFNIPIIENPNINEDNNDNTIVITNTDLNNNENEPIKDIEVNKNNQTDQYINNPKINKNIITYILIGLGFLVIISAGLLLSIRKKQLKN